VKERTDEQGLMELRGANPEEALADLYDLLVRRAVEAALVGLGYSPARVKTERFGAMGG
jgi:hypothetical protein